MKLSQVLENTKENLCVNDCEIEDIIYDSRKARANTLFICLKGRDADGHSFALDAYNKGCRVFCAEQSVVLPEDAQVIKYEDTRRLLALSSANLFCHPADKLFKIAVTGTKGKTSTLCMIASILKKSGRNVGTIGSLGTYFCGKGWKNDNSTPESYLLHKYFRQMVDAGVDTVIMEASSQSFKMKRVYGIEFDMGIFTNLSPDHIGEGEHKDWNEYKSCKRELFNACKVGFFNTDDDEAEFMMTDTACKKITYSVKQENADYRGSRCEFFSKDGKLFSSFDFCGKSKKTRFTVPHPGETGVYNCLCSSTVCSEMGVDENTVLSGLCEVTIRGRNEIYHSSKGFTVIIDYAYNEGSIKKVFDMLEPYRKTRIITVFGCGGGKSHLRRFAMGDTVTKHSDIAVITSDNPRFDSMEAIIADIKKGITSPRGEVMEIHNRQEAIEYAIGIARKDDIVLIAGKGHEDYEEIRGVKYKFDEPKIVIDCLNKLQDN